MISMISFSEMFNKLTDKLELWVEKGIVMLPNLFVAGLVITGFIFLARALARVVEKVVGRYMSDPMVTSLFKNLVYLLTVLVGIFLGLTVMELDKTVTSLLAGAGIVGLALGFAFQEIALNIISGIGIALKKPLQVGDIIETNDQFGEIIKVRLRTTVMRLPSGQHLLIPNKELFQKQVKIYTTGVRRVEVNVGVSYSDDLGHVREIALDAISKLDCVLGTPAPRLYFKEFGDSSINFMLFFWINYDNQTDFFEARSQAVMCIKKAFDREDINIPFPIRTLYMGKSDHSLKMKVEALANQN